MRPRQKEPRNQKTGMQVTTPSGAAAVGRSEETGIALEPWFGQVRERALMKEVMRMDQWFWICGGLTPHRNLDDLRSGIKEGLINRQDEYGATALALSVGSHWTEGVAELLRAGADTELRDYRTGSTALYRAALDRDQAMVALLVSAGANPDNPNYWGVTPRSW